ncbi:MAG TPA: GAF domain-containing sensor histidine kinase [Flavobacteriales bacterium]
MELSAPLTAIDKDIEAVGRIPIVPHILEVVCRTTGMGFAAVARVTEDKWIACSVRDAIGFGLKPGGELVLETTICNEIRQSHNSVVIDEVATDPVFCSHHTPAMYGFQSYISMPIFRKDGSFFGTLCAIDPRPAKVNDPAVIGTFTLFAQLIGMHLDVMDNEERDRAALQEHVRIGELREQFVAVLGHDLRNPLGAITNASGLLLETPRNEEDDQLLRMIQRGAQRMTRLIENTLDLAKGRLGEGLRVHSTMDRPIAGILEQVIGELRSVWPDRRIDTRFELQEPVASDGNRMGQLLSNLLSNALSYGDPRQPVLIEATSGQGRFELTVTNGGAPIPMHLMAQLFKPFTRGKEKEGLGLGLYIASEIARAHGGTLTVHSDAAGTTFRLSMASS